MRPAFPTSDYYEGSAPHPALAEGWPAPSPESRTWFPSSPRLRLRAVLGPASTPGLARCLARHRDTPVCLESDVSVLAGLPLYQVDRGSDDSTLALP